MTAPGVVSLCMIVKNEANNIVDCLSTAKQALGPILAEIVIYDTGSTDNTVQLCRQAGAVVEQGYWDDDFARARNASLRMATAPWSLIIDADDMLQVDQKQLCQLLLDHYHDDVIFTSHVYSIDDRQRISSHNVLSRMCRTGLAHFEGAIHEQLAAHMGKQVPTLAIPSSTLHVMHTGYMAESTVAEKSQRNLACSAKQLENIAANAKSSQDDVIGAIADHARCLGGVKRYEEEDSAYAQLVELGPGENTALWNNAVERYGSSLLAQARYGDVPHIVDLLQAHGGSPSHGKWLLGCAAAGLDHHDVAWECLQDLDNVETSLGSVTPARLVLAARASAAMHVGEVEEALATLLALVIEHDDVENSGEILIQLWGERDRSTLLSLLGGARPEVFEAFKRRLSLFVTS